MVTSKKAAGRKVARKQGRKGARGARKAVDVKEKWRFNAADEEFEHSPIIITDGSASIEFDLGEYDHEGGGHHTSAGLRLNTVSANMEHPLSPADQAGDPPGGFICQSFSGLAQFRIEVTVKVGDDEETFIIRGRNTPLLGSPAVDFNIGKFKKDHVNFPPKYPSGTRFVNPDGNITRLRIFRGNSPNPVHDCPLAGKNGVQYTVSDPHAFV